MNLDFPLELETQEHKVKPQNSATRPNWYKILLPRKLTLWAIECLKEEVNLKNFQKFRKVSASCKNNGKTIFVRLLFESKLYYGGHCYGNESKLAGLPVSYLIEVNKGILKGNSMDYTIGKGVKYNEVYPVFDKTIKLSEDSKLVTEKNKLYKFLRKYKIPEVKK